MEYPRYSADNIIMDFTDNNGTDEIPKCLVTSPKLACFRNLLSKDIIPRYRLVKTTELVLVHSI